LAFSDIVVAAADVAAVGTEDLAVAAAADAAVDSDALLP
jgi:hypothetical protein